VSVGGAAKEAQQRHIKDIGDLVLGQSHACRQLNRDQASPERLFERLAHAEVGGQGQRGHQLGQSQPLHHS
jgi:hypothetical protein